MKNMSTRSMLQTQTIVQAIPVFIVLSVFQACGHDRAATTSATAVPPPSTQDSRATNGEVSPAAASSPESATASALPSILAVEVPSKVILPNPLTIEAVVEDFQGLVVSVVIRYTIDGGKTYSSQVMALAQSTVDDETDSPYHSYVYSFTTSGPALFKGEIIVPNRGDVDLRQPVIVPILLGEDSARHLVLDVLAQSPGITYALDTPIESGGEAIDFLVTQSTTCSKIRAAIDFVGETDDPPSVFELHHRLQETTSIPHLLLKALDDDGLPVSREDLHKAASSFVRTIPPQSAPTLVVQPATVMPVGWCYDPEKKEYCNGYDPVNNIAPGDPITLDASKSYDPEQAGPLTFRWSILASPMGTSFSDSTAASIPVTIGTTRNTEEATRFYKERYRIEATDIHGLTTTGKILVWVVDNTPPAIEVSEENPLYVYEQCNYDFKQNRVCGNDASYPKVSDKDGSIAKWTVNWGDGTPEETGLTGQFTHSYDDYAEICMWECSRCYDYVMRGWKDCFCHNDCDRFNDSYTLTLTVTDNDGASSQATMSVTVR